MGIQYFFCFCHLFVFLSRFFVYVADLSVQIYFSSSFFCFCYPCALTTELNKLCVYTTELGAKAFGLCQHNTYLGAIAYGVELCYLGAISYDASAP